MKINWFLMGYIFRAVLAGAASASAFSYELYVLGAIAALWALVELGIFLYDLQSTGE